MILRSLIVLRFCQRHHNRITNHTHRTNRQKIDFTQVDWASKKIKGAKESKGKTKLK